MRAEIERLLQEGREREEERERERRRTREVCSCGHMESRHDSVVVRGAEVGTCSVIRLECGCAKFVPVLRVVDHGDLHVGSSFRMGTRGCDSESALMRGLRQLVDAGGDVEWVEGAGTVCWVCEGEKQRGERKGEDVRVWSHVVLISVRTGKVFWDPVFTASKLYKDVVSEPVRTFLLCDEHFKREREGEGKR